MAGRMPASILPSTYLWFSRYVTNHPASTRMVGFKTAAHLPEHRATYGVVLSASVAPGDGVKMNVPSGRAPPIFTTG